MPKNEFRGFYSDSRNTLKWTGDMGRKICCTDQCCDCAALGIHVVIPSNTGEERRNFTEEEYSPSVQEEH